MTVTLGKPVKVDPKYTGRGKRRHGSIEARKANLQVAKRQPGDQIAVEICETKEAAQALASIIRTAGVTKAGRAQAHYVPDRTCGHWITGQAPVDGDNEGGSWFVWAQYSKTIVEQSTAVDPFS